MNWPLLLILWLGGCIIIFGLFFLIRKKQGTVSDETVKISGQHVLEDGKNLFATGIVYFLINFICFVINDKTVSWILFIALTLFSLFQIYTVLSSRLTQAKCCKDFDLWVVFISAIINALIPLAIAIVLLFDRII
ncbi:MAG: hypothetical protein ACYCX2_11785 [Christensenellales bacterium]